MNLNNLENLEQEMKALGFSEKLITLMQERMRTNVPDFKLYDSLPAAKGRLDFTLHFKQSAKSDYYYLGRYEAAMNNDKPLAEGHKYMVIVPPAQEGGRNSVKSFENVSEAIAHFRKMEGNAELAVGKDPSAKVMLANMENGKVNYVSKEFKQTYYAQSLPQTFWLDQGKGFTAEQAVNLMEGRSVYRDDLLSREGIPYKAWMQLDNEKPRDRQNNLTFRQYGDPSYGFDVQKVLDAYQIKELEDPAKREKLEVSIKNGNKPMVTVVKDGQPAKVFIEAAVRYGKLNFYAENGKPEKREEFLKEASRERTLSVTNNIQRGVSAGQELSR